MLIVPQHRRGAVARILKLAKVDASSMPAPGMADIDARYRQSILTDPALVAEPSEEEAAFVAELLALHSPERIAAAYLRQQLAKRPAPEDLSDVVSASPPSAIAPRATAERFETGVWFKVSVGRKHQAEPRWLLPMICKAGGVTKSAVGSIRVYDTETRFEISAAEAARFEAAMRDNGSGERGVTISLAEGGDAPAPPGPSRLPPRSEAAPKTRRYEPSLDAEPPRIDPPSSQRPPPHVLNPKDKGKPKYRAKAGYQPQPGDASRPGGAKAKKRKDHKPPRPPQI